MSAGFCPTVLAKFWGLVRISERWMDRVNQQISMIHSISWGQFILEGSWITLAFSTDYRCHLGLQKKRKQTFSSSFPLFLDQDQENYWEYMKTSTALYLLLIYSFGRDICLPIYLSSFFSSTFASTLQISLLCLFFQLFKLLLCLLAFQLRPPSVSPLCDIPSPALGPCCSVHLGNKHCSISHHHRHH